MQGLMMQRPLLVSEILSYAEEIHAQAQIVSRTVEGGIHRETYAEMGARARQLAAALTRLGLGKGDRIATLAWNGYRHLELYYAIPGIGGICHTINPRLSAEQMIYIINHAADRALFLDLTFVPTIEALADKLPQDMKYIVMTDREHMPETALDVLCYEDLLAAEDPVFDWLEVDENTACGLCYTSGTTGNPKGALYSHRSQVLHAMMVGISMSKSMQPGKTVMPVVPLFHANSWGLAHAAPLCGANLVMPGPALDGASVFDLMQNEAVFSAFGVPTVWLGLLAEIEKRGTKPAAFGEIVVGGSAAAPSLIEFYENQGVDVCHAWGMTEMSPVGTLGALPPHQADLPIAERVALKSRQGRRCFGVDLKIMQDGVEQPHDGQATGELFVRGNTVVSGYFNNSEASDAAIQDGWFGTGDVASISADGFLYIADRTKDLIKSGGEWISSIDVENMALAHDDIANCAVIAVPHPKWDERPVLIAVSAVETPDVEGVLAHLSQALAKWQLPDDIIWVDELPLTATGKVSKLTLRERFKGHVLKS